MPIEKKISKLLPFLIAALIFIVFINGIDYFDLYGKLSRNPMFGRDFLINYNMADLMHKGIVNVYDQAAALKNCNDLGILPTQPFNYPPFLIVVYYPFAFLSPQAAITTMFILNHILLLISILLLLNSVGVKSWKVASAAYIISLLSAPSIDSLFAGQINFLILLLLSLFLFFYGKDKNGLASVSLGMAIALKIIPGIVLLYLLIKRDYKTALYTLAATLGFTFLPVLLWGRGILADYISVNDRYLSVSLGYENQSVRAFFLKYFTANSNYTTVFESNTFALIGFLIVVAALLAVTLMLCRKQTPGTNSSLADYLGISSMMLLGMLVLSFSWSHHALWALPGIIYCFFYLFKPEINERFDLLAGFTCLTLVYIIFSGTISARYGILLIKNYPMLYHSGMFINIVLLVYMLYLRSRLVKS
jgi:hypothetical protein